jgi:hypothetical protein
MAGSGLLPITHCHYAACSRNSCGHMHVALISMHDHVLVGLTRTRYSLSSASVCSASTIVNPSGAPVAAGSNGQMAQQLLHGLQWHH